MNGKQRVIALCLMVVMLLGLLPLGGTAAYAEGDSPPGQETQQELTASDASALSVTSDQVILSQSDESFPLSIDETSTSADEPMEETAAEAETEAEPVPVEDETEPTAQPEETEEGEQPAEEAEETLDAAETEEAASEEIAEEAALDELEAPELDGIRSVNGNGTNLTTYNVTTGAYIGMMDSSDDVYYKGEPILYVIPASQYTDGSTDYNTYSARKAVMDANRSAATVAYCFNKNSKNPYNHTTGYYFSDGLEGQEDDDDYDAFDYGYIGIYCYYNKLSSISPSTFVGYTDGRNSSYTTDELYQHILSVALNGYPNNYSNYQGSLTDDQFRNLTQMAIWYFTDYSSISISYSYADGGYLFDGSYLMSTAEYNVFYNLVTNVLSDSVLDKDGLSHYIDMYESTGRAYDQESTAKSYQHLLAVTYSPAIADGAELDSTSTTETETSTEVTSTVETTTTSSTNTLKLTKVVNGSEEEKNTASTFDVYFWDITGTTAYAIAGTLNYASVDASGNKIDQSLSASTVSTAPTGFPSGTSVYRLRKISGVALKDGESITFTTTTSYNWGYLIVETSGEDYDTGVKVLTTGSTSNVAYDMTSNGAYKYVAEAATADKYAEVTYTNASRTTETDPTTPVGNTLTLTGEIDGEDAGDSFTYDIYISDASGNPVTSGVTITTDSGTTDAALTTNTDTLYVGDGSQYGKLTVTLKAGEKIELNGMPEGYSYVVIQRPTDGYAVTKTNGKNYNNGTAATDPIHYTDGNGSYYVTGTDDTGTGLVNIVYTNAPVEATTETGTGVLTLTNTVEHLTTGSDNKNDFVFDIYLYKNVDSDDGNAVITPVTGATLTVDGKTVPLDSTTTTPAGGTYGTYGHAQITLGDEDTATITGLPEGYSYRIVEQDPGTNYVPNAYISQYTGTDTTAQRVAETDASSNVIVGYTDEDLDPAVTKVALTFHNQELDIPAESGTFLLYPTIKECEDWKTGDPDHDQCENLTITDDDKNTVFQYTIYLYTTSGTTGAKALDTSSLTVTFPDGTTKTGAAAGFTTENTSMMRDSSQGQGERTGTFTVLTVELTEGQQLLISGMPDDYSYEVVEANPGDHFTTAVQDSETAKAEIASNWTEGRGVDDETDGRNTFWYEENCIKYTKKVVNFINIPHYIAKTPETTNNALTVKKVVVGGTSTSTFNFNVYLYNDDGTGITDPVTVTYSDGTVQTVTPTAYTGRPAAETTSRSYGVVSLNLGNGQDAVISGLPDSYNYIVVEGYNSTYKLAALADEGMSGIVSSGNGDHARLVSSSTSYNGYVKATGCSKETSETFTNVYQSTTGNYTLTIGKEISGGEEHEGRTYGYDVWVQTSSGAAPFTGEQSVVFTDGENVWTETVTFESQYKYASGFGYSGKNGYWSHADLNIEAGQSATICGLPSGYSYVVSENWPSWDEFYEVGVSYMESGASKDTYSGTVDGVTYSRVFNGYVFESGVTRSSSRVTYLNSYGKALTLEKQVSGSLASTDDEFTFTVTLRRKNGTAFTNPVMLEYEGMAENYDGWSGYITSSKSTLDNANSPVSGTYTQMYMAVTQRKYANPDSQGRLTVTLKAGESVTMYIKDSTYDDDFTYTIVETDNKDYDSTSIDVTEGLGYVNNSTRTVSTNYGETAAAKTHIVYTNSKNPTRGTGIALDVLPYVFLAVSASAVLAGWLYCRKRKHSD